MDEVEVARQLQRYSKRFSAGAFATPTSRELSTADVRSWGETVGVAKQRAKRTRVYDWSGRIREVPAGARTLRNLARPEGAPIPDLSEFDLVWSYVEDRELTDGLRAQGREVSWYRISAASEIVAVWGRAGEGSRIDEVDRVTVRNVGMVRRDVVEAMRAEAVALSGWHDDYPYYSDGSWGALSLRGFYRDPALGVKPAEMGRKWHEDHPGAADLRCDWTDLVRRCPAMIDWIGSQGWRNLERVRVLRMAGRDGRGGRLGRHSDITDRSMGTRVGEVVRFHVPLVTHPDIAMHWWDLDGIERRTNLTDGDVWYLDARKPHAVSNPTGVDRLHLTVDVIVDDRVQRQIVR
jgi:hypothetical protein